jgi:competence protein ComGC
MPFCGDCRVEHVATDQSFCSQECLERKVGPIRQTLITDEQLSAARKAPLRTGWSLWFRSIPTLVLKMLPIAAVIATASSVTGEYDFDAASPPSLLIFWLLLAYGGAVAGTILTQRYTGFNSGNPYTWAARRFLPWIAVWVLVIAFTIAGFFLLIVPGVIISMRLIWADEFVLTHSFSPFSALRASWKLTKGRVSETFAFQFVLGLAENVILIPGLVLIALIPMILSLIGAQTTAVGSFITTTLTVTFLLVMYTSFHAPEVVYFYSSRAAGAESEWKRSRLALALVTAFLALIVLLIVATIAIPSLLRSRQAANEASAVANLRTINAAEMRYPPSAGGKYGSIPELITAGLLDTRFDGQVSGYSFTVNASDSNYTATATPMSANTGRYGYYSGPDGVIRYQASTNSTCNPCFPTGQPGGRVQ